MFELNVSLKSETRVSRLTIANTALFSLTFHCSDMKLWIIVEIWLGHENPCDISNKVFSN